MRKSTFFSAAGLGIVGVFLTANAASAGYFGHVTFDHDPVVPGQSIGATGECGGEGFKGVALHSTILEPVTIPITGKENEYGFFPVGGTAKVKKDAKPGTYSVKYKCGVHNLSTKLTVVAKDGKPAPKPTKTTTPEKPKPTTGQVVVKPKGAAETGDGEVVEAAPRSSGPGAGVFLVGGAAALAVGAGGAFALRRVRKEN